MVHPDSGFSVRSAVFYGFSEPVESSVKQMPFNCPSGNCNCDSFDSLAICSVCNDLLDSLTKKRTTNKDPILRVSLDRGNSAILVCSGVSSHLSSGLWLNNSGNFAGFYVGNHINGVIMNTFGTGNGSATCSLRSIDTLIWSMTILKIRPDPSSASAVWPNMNPYTIVLSLTIPP